MIPSRTLVSISATILVACGGAGSGPTSKTIASACNTFRTGNVVTTWSELDLEHAGSVGAGPVRYNVDLIRTGSETHGGSIQVNTGAYTIFLSEDLKMTFMDGDRRDVAATETRSFPNCPEFKVAYSVDMPTSPQAKQIPYGNFKDQLTISSVSMTAKWTDDSLNIE